MNEDNKKFHIRIDPEIFSLFPEYRRGLVIADRLTNGPSPQSLIERLRDEEQRVRSELAGQDINLVPRLERWREAFRVIGIKPTKFRPSIDALARRVVSGNDLPSINILADIGNIVSLRYLIPVGMHAIDHLQQGMQLRKAEGTELFYPFGSGELEHPEPGEIIFTDGGLVMTRRWVWRQAMHTLLEPSTTAVEVNIDLMPPLPEGLEEEIFHSISALILEYCGGRIWTTMLAKEQPEQPLFIPDNASPETARR